MFGIDDNLNLTATSIVRHAFLPKRQIKKTNRFYFPVERTKIPSSFFFSSNDWINIEKNDHQCSFYFLISLVKVIALIIDLNIKLEKRKNKNNEIDFVMINVKFISVKKTTVVVVYSHLMFLSLHWLSKVNLTRRIIR